MRKSLLNTSEVVGYLYDHKLEEKVTGATSKNPGTPYIRGSVSVATDDECLNVIDVYYVYVAPSYKGKDGADHTNSTFAALKNIIDGKTGTIVRDGHDKAGFCRLNCNLQLSEWVDKNDTDKINSFLRNETRFFNLVNKKEDAKAKFDTDMFITKVREIEANEEKDIPAHFVLEGIIFDWQKNPMPVSYKIYDAAAQDYFNSLELPILTKVSGKQVATTIKVKHTEESAFGEPEVSYTTRSTKEFVVTSAKKEPYGFGDEDSITTEEAKELMAKRERNIAQIKADWAKWYDNGSETKANATPEFSF